ncbi:unnamed protein product [[Candida] boidinii]|uniref:Unnamed protein product n=1 Tax=Candida boidinii TaxID=5477 RepID=A0ACB5TQF7_CANBO|nr:unnamed protein product [[Candida] boidinii]GMF63688.1 unnamed protein product [[Candida] boidinii]
MGQPIVRLFIYGQLSPAAASPRPPQPAALFQPHTKIFLTLTGTRVTEQPAPHGSQVPLGQCHPPDQQTSRPADQQTSSSSSSSHHVPRPKAHRAPPRITAQAISDLWISETL